MIEALAASLASNDSREAGAILARLLGDALQKTAEWSRSSWIDHITDLSVTSIDGALEIRGLAIWGQERGQWLEPFWARLEGASMEMAFADRALGLAKTDYTLREKVRARLLSSPVEDWLFRFRP